MNNYLDLMIIGIILFSIIISLLRGFVREVMSLASWIVAFLVANKFLSLFSNLFNSNRSTLCS